ncbi:ribosome maturation factor RimM [Barrientosiimonas marina]|uniref:Ribosome maturation factor RimM n=1 Tax=Lentibacillus kimchii TaxID=1542911 RepID=A0ABW2UPD7_9BACI
MTELFNAGQIVNTHGIKGEVKVQRITDFPERFAYGNELLVELENGTKQTFTIDGYRSHKGFDLLHFAGFDSINDVEPFKGLYLKVTGDQLTELEENAFYYHEIIGCAVYQTNGDYLGDIKEILAPGANDVWVIERASGQDALIPYIEDVVKQVDVSSRQVVIEPMEGLLD